MHTAKLPRSENPSPEGSKDPLGLILLRRRVKKPNVRFDAAMRINWRGAGLYALTLRVEGVGCSRREMKNRGVEIFNEAGGFLIAPEFACGA